MKQIERNVYNYTQGNFYQHKHWGKGYTAREMFIKLINLCNN